MSSANITRVSAQERSTMITAKSYVVTVDVSGLGLDQQPLTDPDTFVSTSRATFTTTGGDTHIDLIADRVLDVTLDDKQLDASSFADSKFRFSAPAGEHTLTITALCRYSHTGEGLHRFVDPSDDKVYLYTQFESADARRMYANFEQPDQKATFQLDVVAPLHWTVISNSRAVSPVDAGNGNGVWKFAPTPVISTYITALVAGEYHVRKGSVQSVKGEIPADLLCRASMVEHLDAERIMTTTQRGFEAFEAAFGTPYPFDSYDQIFVPEFNAGAMENAGCVTIRDEYLFRSRVSQAAYEGRDNTILHELCHMWFGDLVTMTWWDDLWLNESFAEWGSHFAQEDIVAKHGGIDPWVSFANARKGWAYRQDQLPTTHPIAADMVDLVAVEQNFDGITYAKGASALKQLVAQVGRENFLAGVKEYFAEHAWSNTQLSDLLGALQKASGRDLSNFSAEWLETTGVNTMRPDFDVDAEGRFTRFEVLQSADANHPTLRTHRMDIKVFSLVEDRLVETRRVELDVTGERTEVAELVGVERGDLVLLNASDLTYAKVRLDDASLKTLVEHIDVLDDDLARAICWGAAWDMCRDAEMRSGDYVDLVLRGIAGETDSTAINTLRMQAATAALAYTPVEARPASRARLVAGFAGLLKDAEPGSDHQLTFANALVQAADSTAAADLLKGWLQGEEVPSGLEVDADMRWRIVTALARMGAIGEDEIAAELERDTTITGVEAAAGARSALKTVESKAASWQRATMDASTPNGTHDAICRGFWSYGQEWLLSGYAQRYLEMAGRISDKAEEWAGRGHAAEEVALVLLFPSVVADRAFLDRVKGELADGRHSDGVSRVLREQVDACERALRCQAFSSK